MALQSVHPLGPVVVRDGTSGRDHAGADAAPADRASHGHAHHGHGQDGHGQDDHGHDRPGHAHGDAHGHAVRRAPAVGAFRPGFSLLRASVADRLIGAGLVLGLLWLAVYAVLK